MKTVVELLLAWKRGDISDAEAMVALGLRDLKELIEASDEAEGLAALDRGEGVDFDQVMDECDEIIRQADLRKAIQVGVDDWRAGRVDDRPIDEILDEIEGEEEG